MSWPRGGDLGKGGWGKAKREEHFDRDGDDDDDDEDDGEDDVDDDDLQCKQCHV